MRPEAFELSSACCYEKDPSFVKDGIPGSEICPIKPISQRWNLVGEPLDKP